MVSPFVVVHMLCTSSYAYKFKGFFVWFMAMQEEKISARTIEIQKLLLNYHGKMHGYPLFSFWISIALAKVCFSHIVTNREKIALYYRRYCP